MGRGATGCVPTGAEDVGCGLGRAVKEFSEVTNRGEFGAAIGCVAGAGVAVAPDGVLAAGRT